MSQRFEKHLRDCATFTNGVTDGYGPSVFHRELKNIYGIVPLSSTASPMDHTRWYFTKSCKTFTGLCHNHQRVHRRLDRRTIPTDLRTSWSARMSDTCLSAQIPTEFPTDRKVWRDFWTFLVRISINFRQYYRRNLMPPTTINVRR